ncbi:MAG TPA: hypothetical protein VF395_07690 [Polyangiaceae bacterium]
MLIRRLCMTGLTLGVALVVSCSSDKTSPPAEGGGVGAKCSENSQCTGYGKPACVTEIKPLADLVAAGDPKTKPFKDFTLPFPGGYCSTTLQDPCTSDADCGAGGGCFLAFEGAPQTTIDALANLNPPLPFDIHKFADIGICLKTCASDGDCRRIENYQCLTPLQQFLTSINQDYKKTFCIQDVDVSYLLQSPPGDGGS